MQELSGAATAPSPSCPTAALELQIWQCLEGVAGGPQPGAHLRATSIMQPFPMSIAFG